MSVTDVRISGRWRRTRPTVQIEGGSYPLQDARQLWQILDGFLACSDEEGPSTGPGGGGDHDPGTSPRLPPSDPRQERPVSGRRRCFCHLL